MTLEVVEIPKGYVKLERESNSPLKLSEELIKEALDGFEQPYKDCNTYSLEDYIKHSLNHGISFVIYQESTERDEMTFPDSGYRYEIKKTKTEPALRSYLDNYNPETGSYDELRIFAKEASVESMKSLWGEIEKLSKAALEAEAQSAPQEYKEVEATSQS